MKFDLVFENSGDSIPFEICYNQDLFEYFVDRCQKESSIQFSDSGRLARSVDQHLRELHWAISKTNEVLYDLSGKKFLEQTDLLQYLDQYFLNQTHAEWVLSQNTVVDVEQLKISTSGNKSRLGYLLHESLPDNQLVLRLAHALSVLGYIYPYEEINMCIHRLEGLFLKENMEFSSVNKWNVFDNPFTESMISNNDVVNFCFGYTYVGRQYYNKFECFDNDLEFDDHYNYETLEYSFNVNLSKPQTIPYSKEFLSWTIQHGIKPITTQLPIANCMDLEKNLFEYRKILYKNSKSANQAIINLY